MTIDLPPHVDYPSFVESDLGRYQTAIIRHPSADARMLPQIAPVSKHLAAFPESVMMPLPSAFSLLAASQIHISATKEYGQISVNTSPASKGCQKLILQQGLSYIQYISAEELRLFKHWYRRSLSSWH